jgi:hypothetical protein
MKAVLLPVVFVALVTSCKKNPPTPEEQAAKGKLATQLLGKWNDQEDGSLAWEFLEEGKCKALGEMDCKYEIKTETATVLSLKYNATDSWDEVEVTFENPDKASWKNLTTEKEDPESAVTKIVRVK